MSQTDSARSARLAGALFDEVVAPLAQERRARGKQSEFPLGPEPASTYFTPPGLRTMESADFEIAGGGTIDGLLEALVAHWAARGEAELVALAPRMREIAAALREEEARSDGTVDVLCYTLF